MMNLIANLLPVYVWSLLSGAVLTVGDLTLRSWLATRWSHGFELVFLIYVIGIFLMMMSFFHQNIALATVAAVIVNAVGYLLAAYFLYGDTIGAWQIMGITLGIIAFAIIELA